MEGIIIVVIIAIAVVIILNSFKKGTKCKIILDDEHPIELDDMTIILWAEVKFDGNTYEVYEDKETFDDCDATPIMYVAQTKKGNKALKTYKVIDGKLEQKILDIFWAQLSKENAKNK